MPLLLSLSRNLFWPNLTIIGKFGFITIIFLILIQKSPGLLGENGKFALLEDIDHQLQSFFGVEWWKRDPSPIFTMDLRFFP